MPHPPYVYSTKNATKHVRLYVFVHMRLLFVLANIAMYKRCVKPSKCRKILYNIKSTFEE